MTADHIDTITEELKAARSDLLAAFDNIAEVIIRLYGRDEYEMAVMEARRHER